MPVVVHTPQSSIEPKGNVILLHERYGLVQHTLDLANRMTEAGFRVATPNLFYNVEDQAGLREGRTRARPDESAVMSLLQEVAAVLAEGGHDDLRLAMVGVCQTGSYPVLFSSLHKLDACILLYGGVMDWQETSGTGSSLASCLQGVTTPVLGLFGEKDHTIPVDGVLKVRDCLEQERLSYRFHILAGMPHGWLNSTMSGRYRELEAESAMALILEFLEDYLASELAGERPVEWLFSSETAKDYDFTKNVRLE